MTREEIVNKKKEEIKNKIDKLRVKNGIGINIEFLKPKTEKLIKYKESESVENINPRPPNEAKGSEEIEKANGLRGVISFIYFICPLPSVTSPRPPSPSLTFQSHLPEGQEIKFTLSTIFNLLFN